MGELELWTSLLKILWDANRVITLLVVRVNFIVERERDHAEHMD